MIDTLRDMLRSVATAFAVFSRIRVPCGQWKAENMRFVLASFPLVGVVLGLLLAVWWWLCSRLAFGCILFSAGITLLPLLFTGGIHLDGFCDTVDALSSRAESEKKHAILKDPHIGAFAAIGVSAYLLGYFALGTALDTGRASVALLFFVPVLSRATAGLVSVFSASASEGLLETLRKAAPGNSAKWALAGWFGLCAIAMIAVSPLTGMVAVLAAALCGLLVWRQAKRQFGGMSGDVAGYLLQMCELAMLFALTLMQGVIRI